MHSNASSGRAKFAAERVGEKMRTAFFIQHSGFVARDSRDSLDPGIEKAARLISLL
jgi:hypothetical protein